MRYITAMLYCFIFSTITFSQWEVKKSGVTTALYDITFVDSLYGWAVGDSGTIIQTTDGGTTWSKQYPQSDSLELEV